MTSFWARLAGLVLLFAACGGDPGAGGKASGEAAPRSVPVAAAVAAPFPRVLTLSGTLTPLEEVQVAARVEGPITDVKVDLGDRVARDQPLASIRPIDYKARVSELEAALSQARRDVDRIQALGGAASAEELELARTRLAEAKAQRSLAGRQLGDTVVRSPFAGAIAARHVAPGTYVKIGAPLFDVVATERLRLTLEVPERYAAVVEPGTPATIHLRGALVLGEDRPPASARAATTADPRAAEATITRVAPVVRETTRTFTAEAVFAPGESALRPGMFVVADLALGREAASVRVPRAAVFRVLGHDRVMQVDGGVARPVDVELLAEDAGAAVILGLPVGAQVIVRGASTVAPGAPVTPIAEPIAASTAEGAAAGPVPGDSSSPPVPEDPKRANSAAASPGPASASAGPAPGGRDEATARPLPRDRGSSAPAPVRSAQP
ncbi:MAG: efflux RND transporter periplasmic adaptor subunit [Nannocystaceae bacterium]